MSKGSGIETAPATPAPNNRGKRASGKYIDVYFQRYRWFSIGCIPPGILSPLVDCVTSLWDRKRREASHLRKMGRRRFSMELQISSTNHLASESILPVDRNQRTSPAKRMRIDQRRRLLLFTYASIVSHIQNDICVVPRAAPAGEGARRRGKPGQQLLQ